MDQNKVSAFLIKLRKDKCITQDVLADFLGVSNKTISKWETGVSLPDTFYLPLLSKYYNISVDEILNGEFNQESNQFKFRKKFIFILLFIVVYFLISNFYISLVYIRNRDDMFVSYLLVINIILCFIFLLVSILNAFKNKDILRIIYFIFTTIFLIEELNYIFMMISLLIN